MNQFNSNSPETKPPQLTIQNAATSSSNSADGGVSCDGGATNEVIDLTNELSSLQCKPYTLMHAQQEKHLKQLHPAHHFGFATIPQIRPQIPWMEVDGGVCMDGTRSATATLTYGDILSTAVSIIFRAITVYINIKLALTYHSQGQQDYFIWTVICIVTPMCVTMLIHANM